MDENSGIEQAQAGAPGVLTIDLAALAANYRLLCRKAGTSEVAAVVKADAYGLGAARVARALYAAGCRNFFVAYFSEAEELGPHLPSDARIHVLGGLQPGSEAACAAAGFVPVLNSLEQIRNWAAMARARGTILPASLQVDTGMSRLGLSPEEIDELHAHDMFLEGLRVETILSHLACADDPGHEANPQQLARMRDIRARFPQGALSFANSGGIFLGEVYHGRIARPGIALYGGAPIGSAPNPMHPVVRLDVRVIQTRTVPAGTLVGYGGTYVATAETQLATIAAGYADGLPRHLSSKGAAYFAGVRLPIVGRVSMDSITLDIGGLRPGTLRLGSLVELIGPHQTLEQIASDAGTISYEILTRLGRRYHRDYRPDTAGAADRSEQRQT